MNDVTELRAFFGTEYELKLVGLSLLLGAVLGAVFDLFRAIRLAIKHGDVMVFIEDAVFFFVYGMSFYSFCVALCGGALRAFVAVFMTVGFIVYLVFPGGLVKNILATALKTLIMLAKHAAKLIFGRKI